MRTEFTAGIEAAWLDVLTFVPKCIGFLVVLIVGMLVANVLGNGVTKLSQKVGLDRWLERGGVRAALEKSGWSVSTILGRLVYYTLALFVLQLAFGVFGPNPISSLLTRVIAFLPNIFVAIVITVIAASIAGAVKEITQASLGGLSYGRMLATAASAAILVVGIFAALNQLNIAPAIVNGLFYAILAVVVGSAIVAIGGGGIVPMRGVWERALNRIDAEAPRIQAQIQNLPQSVGTPQQHAPHPAAPPWMPVPRPDRAQMEHIQREEDYTPR